MLLDKDDHLQHHLRFHTFVLMHRQLHHKLIQSWCAATAVSATRVGSCGARQTLTSSTVGELTLFEKHQGVPVMYKLDVRLLCDVWSLLRLCRITRFLYADSELNSFMYSLMFNLSC